MLGNGLKTCTNIKWILVSSMARLQDEGDINGCKATLHIPTTYLPHMGTKT
jgi:hypothetical protein